MKITRSQYGAAYRVGLKHHDGEFGITEAKRLLKPTGLNPASAADLVYGVTHLLKGTLYIRSLSLAVTDDYLTWIRRDRGDRALANALVALDAHIKYNTTKLNAPSPGLRSLLQQHRKLLTAPSESVLILTWNDKESAGFTDEFPLEWFAGEGTLKQKQHTVRDRQRNRYRAYCDVTVRGKVANLDYEAYPEENAHDGMLLGVIQLLFGDEDRCFLAGVKWKPQGSTIFADTAYTSPNVIVPPERDYIPPSEPGAKVEREVRERPGQAAFRRKLKTVYANRCCISGCAVSEALDGAHIDPYKAPASDNIRNGLLLRRDLHKLFDLHLIAVDPRTLLVHVAKCARGQAGYDQFHGVSLRLPGESTHQPDQGALRRHWQKKHD